jgi:hypothetical protein
LFSPLYIVLLASPSRRRPAGAGDHSHRHPGKLVDFAPFFVGIKTGIYRSEGLEPQFIVMRSGIIIPALLSANSITRRSTVRRFVRRCPACRSRMIATLNHQAEFFFFTRNRDISACKT